LVPVEIKSRDIEIRRRRSGRFWRTFLVFQNGGTQYEVEIGAGGPSSALFLGGGIGSGSSPSLFSNLSDVLVTGLAGLDGVYWDAGTSRWKNRSLQQRREDLGLLIGKRQAKTSGYTVVATDRGSFIDYTSGTVTLALTAAATLGNGFSFAVYNSGSGTITVDPDGSETIRRAAATSTTITLTQGQGAILVCDGIGWSDLLYIASGGGGGGGLDHGQVMRRSYFRP
jgi:hypothetical protein